MINLQKDAIVKGIQVLVIIAVITTILGGLFFYYKDKEAQRIEREQTIRDLTITMKSLEETNKTLEKQLEDEKAREKVVVEYRDRVKIVEKKTQEKKQDVKKIDVLTTEELNKKFKDIVSCFENC